MKWLLRGLLIRWRGKGMINSSQRICTCIYVVLDNKRPFLEPKHASALQSANEMLILDRSEQTGADVAIGPLCCSLLGRLCLQLP